MSFQQVIMDHIPAVVSSAILAIPAVAHTLVAEAGIESPAWLGSVTQISAFGLVAWIVFHMFSTWLPKQQEEHAKQLADQRDVHTVATETIARAHVDAMKSASDSFKEALHQQRQDLLALRFVCQATPIKSENNIPIR
jgi:hypothetical protein